jgi:hypothetical protein
MHNHFLSFVLVLILGVIPVLAGDLDAPAGPLDPASAMPTLGDLYDRLLTGAEPTLRTSFLEPGAGPGSTGLTLADLLATLPEADNTAGASTFVELPGKGPETEPIKVAVDLGLSDGLNVEILSGVTEGDEIVQRPPKEIN